MSQGYVYSGSSNTTVREGTVSLTERAEHGNPGEGGVTIEDTAGTLAIVGQKSFSVTESACSATGTFSGYVGSRSYKRGGADAKVSASRDIEVTLTDLNATLGFRIFAASSNSNYGKRPAETIANRGAWLMASSTMAGIVGQYGRTSFSSNTNMDAADYRNQHPADVLADMAMAAGGYNYYVADWGNGAELTFRDDNVSTADSSLLRISDVSSDLDTTTVATFSTGTTYAPVDDAELSRDPSNVYSKLAYTYAKGTTISERTSTATAFNGERDGVASNSLVSTSAKAADETTRLLWEHHTEEDVISVTIHVHRSRVNHLRRGERIQAKFSEFATEGYGSFTWFRVLERTVKPLIPAGTSYEMRLKLSPQEATYVPGNCVDLYPGTASGTRYPLGSFQSDGVVYYYRSGYAAPSIPDATYIGSWHFAELGAGGLGTIDYAGDCVQNNLVFMTVGNGTWTIQTERYGGTVRALYVATGPEYSSTTIVDTINSGDSVVVTISDATDGDCIRVVRIYDVGGPGACGSKWGWSAAAYVAA